MEIIGYAIAKQTLRLDISGEICFIKGKRYKMFKHEPSIGEAWLANETRGLHIVESRNRHLYKSFNFEEKEMKTKEKFTYRSEKYWVNNENGHYTWCIETIHFKTISKHKYPTADAAEMGMKNHANTNRIQLIEKEKIKDAKVTPTTAVDEIMELIKKVLEKIILDK